MAPANARDQRVLKRRMLSLRILRAPPRDCGGPDCFFRVRPPYGARDGPGFPVDKEASDESVRRRGLVLLLIGVSREQTRDIRPAHSARSRGMRSQSWVRSWSLCAVLVASAVTAFADGTTSLHGRVRDASGQPLPSVSVNVTGNASSRASVTDSTGAYEISALPPGRYDVAFKLLDFATVFERDVHVQEGSASVLDATLQLALSAEVLVTAGVASAATQSVVTTATTGPGAPRRLPEAQRPRPVQHRGRAGRLRPDGHGLRRQMELHGPDSGARAPRRRPCSTRV
jgi:hypothetical protein